MKTLDVVISIKDPLTVSVSNCLEITAVENEDGQIVELDVPDFARIILGNKISLGTPKESFKINKIVKRKAPGLPVYDLKMASRTKASLFIMPMMPGPKEAYFYDKFFLNCFVGTEKETNVIALLYRYSGIAMFVEFEKALQGFKNFKSVSDPSNQTVLFVFEVPKKYFRDFEKFMNGQYSKISDSYKKRILEFHKVSATSVIGQILYKDPKRREELNAKIVDPSKPTEGIAKDAELYSIPDLETETFKPEIYAV
jgi:hypothetical protein